MNKKLIIGAAIGNCVHVGGVLNFLQLAEEQGYKTKFLGPAVSIRELLGAIEESDPEYVAVGYRLTPEVGYRLFKELKAAAREKGLDNRKFLFGGTLPVARMAKKVGFFHEIFSGEEGLDEIIAFLKGSKKEGDSDEYPQTLIERIKAKSPFPVLRHHFGLPEFEATVEGIKTIAESKVLDIISIGPDQNTQESFFRPGEIDPRLTGAGGVPLRKKEDFVALYEASRRGNYPLLRCYSGTRDLLKMAELLRETINNAWCAVPLSWYNLLDGRSNRQLEEAIEENQKTMAWHGKRGIPVEVNEAHHWSLRDAHDTIAVVMAYLAAYNAKKQGVKDYISQLMLNTPSTISPKMDLAKMLAKKELIATLEDEHFKVWTQIRTGLSSLPPNPARARGQLASSILMGLVLDPDIVHVVAYCEADHAATPAEIIESCEIIRQVITFGLKGLPDYSADREVQERKEELLREADVLIRALQNMAPEDLEDPLTSPANLSRAIKIGLLDAPHLKGNPVGRGDLRTRIINGACYAVDEEGRIINEEERVWKIAGRIT